MQGLLLSHHCHHSPLTTPDSTPKESVKKKKSFFEILSKSVVKHSKSGQSATHRPFHSPSVVPQSPLRAPSVKPPVVPTRPPTLSNPVVTPPVIADMGEEVTVADLTKHIKQAFEEISLSANYPMPTFYGKKGENPEDHCMKAEDYFKSELPENGDHG